MQAENEREFDSYFTQIEQAKFESRYVKQEKIGRGSGATVYKAKDQELKKQVAIKQYNRDQLYEQNQIDVIREIQLLKFLRKMNTTQYVPKFQDAYRVSKENNGFIYCIVLELCQFSLVQYIKSPEFASLSYRDKLQLCSYICEGVNFLHEGGVIHRDLKPANILLTQREKKLTPLIADFGHAKLLQTGVANTTLRGTVKYADPNKLYTSDYGFEWDIYSLGLVILEVMSGGQFLFKIEDINSQMKFMKKMLDELNNLQQTLNKITGLCPQIRSLIWECLKNKEFKAVEVMTQMKNILSNLNEDSPNTWIQPREQVPNFNKNKQNPTEDMSPQKKTNVISKISTTESDQTQENLKSIEEFSSNRKNSKITLSNERKNPTESSMKKNNTGSEIIYPVSEGSQSDPDPQIQEQISQKKQSRKGYSLNLLGEEEEETFYSFIESEEQKPNIYESEKSSFETSEIKITRSPSLNFQKQRIQKKLSLPKQASEDIQILPKMMKTKQILSKKLEEHEQAVTQSNQLRIFNEKFLKLREIQTCEIDLKDKQKLLLVCIRHLIQSLEIYISKRGENIYTKKYLSIYLDNLIKVERPLREQFFERYLKAERNQSQRILKAHNPSLQEIKQEFEQSLRRLQKPMLMFQLRDLLE